MLTYDFLSQLTKIELASIHESHETPTRFELIFPANAKTNCFTCKTYFQTEFMNASQQVITGLSLSGEVQKRIYQGDNRVITQF